jgi:hypothetical protein
MSWDADLVGHIDGHPVYLADWNYTHNCNHMIADAMERAGEPTVEQVKGPLGPAIGPAWWKRLDGMSAKDGAALLDRVLAEFIADPQHYIAMNPENGWGDYQTLLKVLEEMQFASEKYPSAVWRLHG